MSINKPNFILVGTIDTLKFGTKVLVPSTQNYVPGPKFPGFDDFTVKNMCTPNFTLVSGLELEI